MSATFQKPRLTLPPISQLAPLTPPADSSPFRLPSVSPVDDMSDVSCSDESELRLPDVTEPPAPASLVDWIDASRTRSSQFIAEKTCEMICYLWFAPPPTEQAYPSPSNSPNFISRSTPPSPLQLAVTPTFAQFMRKLLETTQVSQSVIVLSLHYIYNLRGKNRFTPAQPGSEFRIAVAGLMMANKFLDDNTYTNKTWSEVSGIDLSEINKMEREFLLGVDFNLYVDKPTYESWLNLLKGLVLTKERDSRQYRKSRVRSSRNAHITSSAYPATRNYASRVRVSSYRARSTSPTRPSTQQPCYLPTPAYTQLPSPTPRSGSKRSAEAAFSPTSAARSHVPSKRPLSMALQIPPSCDVAGPQSHSPLESLQSFAEMSIDSPVHASHNTRGRREKLVSEPRDSVPETLITSYTVDDARRAPPPQNLYFYTLACSPMEHEDESRRRKARLRYHQPPSADHLAPPSMHSASSASSSSCCYHPHSHLQLPRLQTQYAYQHFQPVRVPAPVVQSASTSPHEMHVNFTSRNYGQATLPHFNDTTWTRPPASASYDLYAHHTQALQSRKVTSTGDSPVPSAPFANAGPPGVQFYPTPLHKSYSIYPSINLSTSSAFRRPN
ncbi:hypothetical protein APHAL10511_002943 [Amanita phalloides]|nr:hypothetical protein APHAL10511_002943 [Amanita phalloides]